MKSDATLAGDPARPITGCAIYAPQLPDPRKNPFGIHVANAGLWRALARHGGFDELCFVLNQPVGADEIDELLDGSRSATRITTATLFQPAAVARLGTLLRGNPGLADLAWQRRHDVGDRAYSLAGFVHTIAPPALRQRIAQSAVAPVQAWDALICTSPVVQQNLRRMFEEWSDYLGGRFGATGRPPRMPMLPVVPLGVDGAAIAAAADRAELRAETRARLGIGADAVVVLWLGRLSFYEKAHPQPMLQAVEQARRDSGRPLCFVMLGWFPDGEEGRRRYEEAARLHAPSVPLHILDGNDRALVGAMWASADIFLSLVDNVQETFGLTPVEAMAAGLPVVASDWDGYRATVEHGRQGFLIPTLGGPPGLGLGMLRQHVFGAESEPHYVGRLARLTAVNVRDAGEAIAALAREPELRRRMGEAGRERVRTNFDWPVVTKRLTELFAELRDIRSRAASFESAPQGRRSDPVKGEPFSTFAGFASAILHAGVVLRAPSAVGISPETAFHGAALNRYAAPALADIEAAYGTLCAEGELTAGAFLGRFPRERRVAMQVCLLWLCKLGLVDWQAPGPGHPSTGRKLRYPPAGVDAAADCRRWACRICSAASS